MVDTNWQDFPDVTTLADSDVLLVMRGAGGVNIPGSALVKKDANGNVSVGTVNSKTRLNIAGAAAAGAPTPGVTSGSAFISNNDNSYGLLIGIEGGSGSSWLQAQRTDGSAATYNLWLNPSGGNVGIGTTSPVGKLDVSSTSRVRWVLTTADVQEICTNAAANLYANKYVDAAAHLFQISGSERFRVEGTWAKVGGPNGLIMQFDGSNAYVRAETGTLFLGATGANVCYVASGGFAPTVDNSKILGSSAQRWSVVYSATGSINTSDERAKQNTAAIPDEWLDAWGDVEWVRYKFKDAVEAKGTSARWHVGLIAQRVRDTFADRGLDAETIGLLCYDKWEEQREPILEERVVDEETIVIGEEETGLLGPDGQPVMRPITAKREILGLVDTGETRITLEAGNRWGLRYDECQAMEAAWQRRELARKDIKITEQDALIADLAERLARLEAA